MGIDEFGKDVEKRKATRRLREEDKAMNAVGSRPEPELAKCEENKLKRSQWALVHSDTYLACAQTIDNLIPGVYGFDLCPNGVLFVRNPINADDLIDFPDSVYDKVINEVETFWQLGARFEKYGFLHRRGYLLYGPAGSGKTCLVQRLVQKIIENDGIVFMSGASSPELFSEGLKVFREIEPDRQIICIFEDIDTMVERWSEAQVLSLLDGENQVNKVINIATTNYPERLDKRIVARPRRFDRIVKIAMPNEVIREAYFKNKLKINGEDGKKWVKETEGLSFAALAELVISVKCLGNSFEETINKLREMSSSKVSSSEFEDNRVGFITLDKTT